MPRFVASRFAVPAGQDRDRRRRCRRARRRSAAPCRRRPRRTRGRRRRRRAWRARFGAFLLFGTSYQSGSDDAVRGEALAELAESAAERLPLVGDDGDGGHGRAPSQRGFLPVRDGHGRAHDEQRREQRERAEQRARRHVGGEVHAAVQPRDDHERRARTTATIHATVRAIGLRTLAVTINAMPT